MSNITKIKIGNTTHDIKDAGAERSSNKVTSLSSSSTDTQYPSAKVVYDELETKADLNSPALTGTPTAPTAAAGTNTTQVATTAFVQGAVLWEKGTGTNSVVQKGGSNIASGIKSVSEGYNTTASGDYSHSEGYSGNHQALIASGYASHAEGEGTQSKGRNSHAEGEMGIAYERGAHVEGKTTKAYGMYTHAEGSETEAGFTDSTTGKVWGDQAVHTEGYQSKAVDRYSHAEGYQTYAGYSPNLTRPNVTDQSSPAYGTPNYDVSSSAHAEGYITKAYGFASHAEGRNTIAKGNYSHAEGQNSQANSAHSHAEGEGTITKGDYSHAEGYNSVVEIDDTITSNTLTSKTDTNGVCVHVEGNANLAIGSSSHAEGKKNFAKGLYSHAEGLTTKATGAASHSEGRSTHASGNKSHAEGHVSVASGENAHAEGYYTQATNFAEHAEGQYNKSNRKTIGYEAQIKAGSTTHSVGIGSSSRRLNAFEIMQNGDAYLYGVGGYDGTNATASTSSTLQHVLNNVGGLTEITWSNLKYLRDNWELTPGMQYRITDYNTTTAQEDTQAAGHQFDIIVVADDNHTLNENARACLHSGDTYFSEAGANLSAWELKYSLDNKYEFEWAKRKNNTYIYYTVESIWGTYTYSNSTMVVNGITYYKFGDVYCKSRRPSPGELTYRYYDYTEPYMSGYRDVLRYDAGTDQITIGDASQEGPYEYAENFVIAYNGTMYYQFVSRGGRSLYCTSDNPSIGDTAYTLIFMSTTIYPAASQQYTISDVTPAGTLGDEGKGVIYYMKDEHNNVCHYDFKNILFNASAVPSLGYNKYYYTFSYMENSASTAITDFSTINFLNTPINPSSSYMYSCHDNVLGTYYTDENRRWRTRLPYIVFRAMESEKYSYESISGQMAYAVEHVGNVIGNNCRKILISTTCSYNKILDSCEQCVLGYGSRYNTIKEYSISVNFRTGSTRNTCGKWSSGITIYGGGNAIGNSCKTINVTGDTNTFGDKCQTMNISGNENTFGADCYQIYFTGSDNSYNNIGMLASNFRWSGGCSNNTVGDRCTYINMGTGCTQNNFDRGNEYIYMGNNCYYNSFGENCYQIYFGPDTAHTTSYYSHIIAEPNVRHVVLNCSATTSVSQQYRYVRLKSSVNIWTSDIYKTITDGNVGQTAWTVYTGTETIINV